VHVSFYSGSSINYKSSQDDNVGWSSFKVLLSNRTRAALQEFQIIFQDPLERQELCVGLQVCGEAQDFFDVKPFGPSTSNDISVQIVAFLLFLCRCLFLLMCPFLLYFVLF
jgi:hypothetical protein